MSAEQNMAIARDFLEIAWNQKDVNALKKYVAPDHQNHGPFSDDLPQGFEGVKAFTSSFLIGFPNVSCTVDNQEADGDLVRTWVTFRGTQTGQLMDIPATGRSVTVPVLVTDRIAGGKIAESWAEWNPDDMLRQLGVA